MLIFATLLRLPATAIAESLERRRDRLAARRANADALGLLRALDFSRPLSFACRVSADTRAHSHVPGTGLRSQSDTKRCTQATRR
jgi:hypothetical protein